MSGTDRSAGTRPDYSDIMDHKRPVSPLFLPMPREKRAAQFSPFKALTGYEDEVAETVRLTDERLSLGEDRMAELDLQLQTLAECGSGATAEVTYFVADSRKTGGSYRTFSGRIRKVDAFLRKLVLDDGSPEGLAVTFEDLYEIVL